MANKILKSIAFPGVPNTYKIPPQADEFSSSSTYVKDSYVTYQGVLYKCINAITTAGSWTGSTNWTEVQIANELQTYVSDLQNSIDDIISSEISQYQGATDVSAGVDGYVPGAESGNTDSFFRSDGTWSTEYVKDYVTAGRKSGSTLGSNATVEGSENIASGQYSHAEGYSVTSTGLATHAEGVNTAATSSASHAEGQFTVASGDNSHAEGSYTIANHLAQHVFGEYNIEDPNSASSTARGNYIEIIGNGTSIIARSNARTLDWNGNEILAGKLTVGSSPTNNMDVATKQYVDSIAGNSVLLGNISFTTSWTQVSTEIYTQTVTVSGFTVTSTSKIDLQPTASQIASLISSGVNSLVIENNNGTLIAYAVGAATTAMTVQCTATEVS